MSGEGSAEPSQFDYTTVLSAIGGSAGGLALLNILLFSVLLCVIVKLFRIIKRHFDVGENVRGPQRQRDVKETPEPLALRETRLALDEVPVVANPSSTPHPDTQDPSTVEPLYSKLNKKRPPVEDIGDSNTGEQLLTHNPESGADSRSPLKSTPWTVWVESEEYSRLSHIDRKQRGRYHSNRYSMPLLNEKPDKKSGVSNSGYEAQPYITPVRPVSHLTTAENDTFLSDVEGPPPPLPIRLSTSLELILESKDTEGEGEKSHAQYPNTPQPVVNEVLYDEIANTVPAKGHSACDAPALEGKKKDFGPDLFYDEVILK